MYKRFSSPTVALVAMLHFAISTEMFLHGNRVDLRSILSDPSHPKRVTGMYVSAWVGGGSEECCVAPLDADGKGEIRLKLSDGDPNAIKFAAQLTREHTVPGTSVRTGPVATHFACGAALIEDLCSVLDGGKAPVGTSARMMSSDLGARCCASAHAPESKQVEVASNVLPLQDIANPQNGVLLHITNCTTNTAAVRKMRLKTSVMTRLNENTRSLLALNTKLTETIGQGVVSSCNSGNMFISAMLTAAPMVPLSYALFALPFREWNSPLEDGVSVVYMAAQAKVHSGLSWVELRALPPDQFAEHYVDALLSRPTCCELTMPYCSDKALDVTGNMCRDTEDISRTLSAPAMAIQGALEAYNSASGAVRKLSPAETIQALSAVVAIQAKGGKRMGAALEANDCENLAGVILSNANGIRAFCARQSSNKGLQQEVQRVLGLDKRLFAQMTRVDVEGMSAVLQRTGELLTSQSQTTSKQPAAYSGPAIDVSLAVVTAKGPSYDAKSTEGRGLCGHGAVVMRHVLPGQSIDSNRRPGQSIDSNRRPGTGGDKGKLKCVYRPLEGTAWLSTVPHSIYPVDAHGKGIPIPIRMQDGTVVPMDVAMLGTCLGQEMYRIGGVSPLHRIEAKLPPVCMGADASPFYHSVFFSGLSAQNGVMGAVSFNAASGQGPPTFGAPVLGLGSDASLSLPVGENLLSDDPKEAARTAQDIRAQASEAWPPRGSPTMTRNVFSYYAPVGSVPDVLSLTGVSATEHICGQFTVAFDNPVHTEVAVQFYGHLSDAFNALNKADSKTDGAVAVASGQFSSATMRIWLPVREMHKRAAAGSVTELSCVRNLRQAVANLRAQTLAETPDKLQQVSARIAEGSKHHIYRCAQGMGMGHSHRYSFA